MVKKIGSELKERLDVLAKEYEKQVFNENLINSLSKDSKKKIYFIC